MTKIVALIVFAGLLLLFQPQSGYCDYDSEYCDFVFKALFEFNLAGSGFTKSFLDRQERTTLYGYDFQVGYKHLLCSIGQSINGDKNVTHFGGVVHGYSTDEWLEIRGYSIYPFIEVGAGYLFSNNGKKSPYGEIYIGVRSGMIQIEAGLRNATFVIKIGTMLGYNIN